jgi:hypothetical protein
MNALTLPIINSGNLFYLVDKNVTKIETSIGDVWAPGNHSLNNALLVNIMMHSIGDTFVASKDSKKFKLDDKGAPTTTPIYLKGEKVVREKAFVEFKGFSGSGASAQAIQMLSILNNGSNFVGINFNINS